MVNSTPYPAPRHAINAPNVHSIDDDRAGVTVLKVHRSDCTTSSSTVRPCRSEHCREAGLARPPRTESSRESGCRLSQMRERGGDGRRLLVRRHVPGLGDDRDGRLREQLPPSLGVDRRDQAVAGAPHDGRRGWSPGTGAWTVDGWGSGTGSCRRCRAGGCWRSGSAVIAAGSSKSTPPVEHRRRPAAGSWNSTPGNSNGSMA